jgi:hypothetical protein
MNRKIWLYKVSPEVAEYYRLNVKDNTNTPDELIARKLTRNIIMSKFLDNDENGNRVYLYGKLLMVVNKNREVIEISNYTLESGCWHKNVAKYNRLNQLLGITNEITYQV